MEPKLTKRVLSEVVQNARPLYREMQQFDGVHTLDATEIVAKTYILAFESYLTKHGYEIVKKDGRDGN